MPDNEPKTFDMAISNIMIGGLPTHPNHYLETDRWLIDNKFVICRLEVLYGYRFTISYKDLPTYEINICCGAQDKPYDEIKEKVLTILLTNDADKPFANLPAISKIKPYFNDIDFCNYIDDLFAKAKNNINKIEIQNLRSQLIHLKQLDIERWSDSELTDYLNQYHVEITDTTDKLHTVTIMETEHLKSLPDNEILTMGWFY